MADHGPACSAAARRLRMRAILLALLAIAARSPDLGTITLDRTDPEVDATIAGVPARLAIALDNGIDLAAGFADRTQLGWQSGGHEEVGRVWVPIRRAVGEITIAGVTASKTIETHGGSCCARHDGTIGAVELPWSVVRIGQGGRTPERRWSAEIDDQSGLSIPWRVGHARIHVVLAPEAPETLVTASAAAMLAKAYGGHFDGQARQAPIAYGVSREVRDFVFDRPVPVLGFTLPRVAVRIADFEGGARLPQVAEAPPAADAIVVSHRPPPAQHRWPAISIGRDLLGRCPVISVYRDAAAIGLVCD